MTCNIIGSSQRFADSAPLCIPCMLRLQGFSSEQCPEGFVAVVRNTLRILSVDNVGEAFNQSISRLRYTPRRLLIHPDYKTLIVAESDYQAVPIADNPELQKRLVVSDASRRRFATPFKYA